MREFERLLSGIYHVLETQNRSSRSINNRIDPEKGSTDEVELISIGCAKNHPEFSPALADPLCRDTENQGIRYVSQTIPVRVMYRFINEHRHEFGVATMCLVLKVARRGFYKWLHKPQSDRAIEDRRLLVLIRVSYAASSGDTARHAPF